MQIFLIFLSLLKGLNPYTNDLIHLGNKGFNLATLTGQGKSVPPAFVITTEIFRCREVVLGYSHTREEFMTRIRNALSEVEKLTGKIFGSPDFSKLEQEQERAGEGQEEYMFYIDRIYDKPGLMIMKLKFSYSETVVFVTDVPEDLLQEATKCPPDECAAGMYPISKKIEEWLKKELGLS